MNLHITIAEKVEQLKLSPQEYNKILTSLDDTESMDAEIIMAESILEKLKYRLYYLKPEQNT